MNHDKKIFKIFNFGIMFNSEMDNITTPSTAGSFKKKKGNGPRKKIPATYNFQELFLCQFLNI